MAIIEIIMKRYIYYLIGFLGFLVSCQEPEYVGVETTRQGITSLTAIFTDGQYKDSEAVSYKLTEQDASSERIIIPIPWFFPESSDNETSANMKSMKIKAELDNNFVISPELGILDLTKDNYFTLKKPDGSCREICITGERVKSSACQVISFSLKNPEIAGVVDNTTNVISLITNDDLSSCLADIQLSAHATISPDPTVTPLNYNEPVEFVVTAHNGLDKQTYTVKKDIPKKIPYGFNPASVELLFSIDATNILGIPWLGTNAPTLGAINNNLVVCMGDGTIPMYFNRITGVKQGNIDLGKAKAASVTSDENNHLLICNHVSGGEMCEIYVTSSVTEEPELFYSFVNTSELPLGAKIKVIGDIKTDAVIIITNEGIAGVSSSSVYTRIVIKDGIINTPELIDISATGLAWGAAPVASTSVVAASTSVEDGVFLAYYGDNIFTYLNGENNISAQLAGGNGNLNVNCLDSKCFNKANYVALFYVSHFPMWSVTPQLYLFDVTDKSKLTGDVTSSPALVLANDAIKSYQTATSSVASGDVLIAPTADGFKIYVYYYDNNCASIGAYVADCIKKN